MVILTPRTILLTYQQYQFILPAIFDSSPTSFGMCCGRMSRVADGTGTLNPHSTLQTVANNYIYQFSNLFLPQK